MIYAGLSLTLVGVLMISNTFKHRNASSKQEAYVHDVYIAPGIYIVNTCEPDSAAGWKNSSVMQFRNLESRTAGDAPQASYKLSDSKYSILPWLFAAFYSIMTLLFIPMFYHLYVFVKNIRESKPFDRENLPNLSMSGKYMVALSSFYLICNMAINLILSGYFNINIQQYYLHYESFLLIFFFGLSGILIKLVTRIALTGEEMQTEQDLTV